MADQLERLKTALAERYTVERELGAGGMATVYLAHDVKHDRQVAVKVLRPELASSLGGERFVREIQIAARLTHPNILALYDSGEADGLLYYVMPYVEGESLRDRLTREKQLPIDEAVRIIGEVADAVGHAHAQGIIHRDIKPENILLEAGHAVVSDFGIAKAVTAAGGTSLTETGLAMGTPTYMSPEQASGVKELDARSDVYSLGCVLYEMLSGDPPYHAATPQAVLARKLAEPVPRLGVVRETVPVSVERATLRALAKLPADRFATTEAFVRALHQASTDEWLEPASRKKSRLVWLSSASAVAVVLLVAAGWWARNRGAEAQTIDRLAVLPLANLMGDPEQEYFVQGMHDALISELGRIGALSVISRQSVMRYRESEKSIPEIATELNVDALVTASVLREADSVFLRAQLIAAFPEERQVWTETFSDEVRNILQLHAAFAGTVAREIEITLTPQEQAVLVAPRVVQADAYDAVLQGRFHMGRRTRAGYEAAIEHFARAIAIDSLYAAGHAGLAQVYVVSTNMRFQRRGDTYSIAKEAALRAVQLDSEMAESHLALGAVYFSFDHNWAAAGTAWQRAVSLNPNDPVARNFYAQWLVTQQRYDEAIAELERALALDPFSLLTSHALARTYRDARQYGMSLEEFRHSLDLDAENFYTYGSIALTYALMRMPEAALAAINRAVELSSGEWQSYAISALVYAVVGQERAAQEALAQVYDLSQTQDVSAAMLAAIHANLGEHDRVFDLLDRAVQMNDPWIFRLNDPTWDAIRDDARFRALLDRLGLPG